MPCAVTSVQLVPIDPTGGVALPTESLPQAVRESCAAMAAFYGIIGHAPPWIGYVSLHDGRAVGGGAFKGPPDANRVEIAYFTVPELQGRGFASATASALVRIARTALPTIVVAAQTLPTPNASNTLLKKLGFGFHGAVQHEEDGEVWEWRLEA
jgi:RimJ/RimL family protein N-acetyltransferase